MKYAITFVVLGLVLLAFTAEAAITLIKGTEISKVGIGTDAITVTRIVDGEVTCYVTRHGKFGAHGVSCVK